MDISSRYGREHNNGSNVFNLDNTSPTVTAKGSSYTITEGGNVISSTYLI